MTKRQAWRAGFLGATVLGVGGAVGMELWAARDDSTDTETWTDLAAEYLPLEPTLAVSGAVLGALLVWWPIHLYRAKRKREGNRS